MDLLERIRKGLFDEADLLEYVTDNDVEIAIAASEACNATEAILDIAARDKDRRVRIAAVKNNNIGVETLRYLAGDTDSEISQIALGRLERINQ